MSGGGNGDAIVLTDEEWYLITQENELQKEELRAETEFYKIYVRRLKIQLKEHGVEPLVMELEHADEETPSPSPSPVAELRSVPTEVPEGNVPEGNVPEGGGVIAAVAPAAPDGPSPTAPSPRAQKAAETLEAAPVEAPVEAAVEAEEEESAAIAAKGDGKLSDKAVAMMGDVALEKQNMEHLDEEKKEKMNTKAAKLAGTGVVLKKKLRDRFGSEIKREDKLMQQAKEKYEAMMAEQGVKGYLKGAAGMGILKVKEKVTKLK